MKHKFNLIWRILFYGIGFLFLLVPITLTLLPKTDNNPVALEIFFYFFIAASLAMGLTIISTPAVSTLLLDQKGFIYKNLRVTVSGHWCTVIFNNNLKEFSGTNNLILPLENKTTFHLLGRILQLLDKNEKYKGSIPIFYFGKFTHNNVKKHIRENAPHLFGELSTERDFQVTLNALEDLIRLYTSKEIKSSLFLHQYNSIYQQYIINGRKSVQGYSHLSKRYSAQISRYTAIWNEVVERHFPNHNNLHKRNSEKLKEINKRYVNYD